MKTLRGCALLFGLLVVGVLMAPLPSEAASITIDGTSASLTSRSCETGYNSCWTIPTGTYGAWTVGNKSGSTARLLIQDNDGAGTATDKIRLRGITFQRTGGGELFVVIEHTFTTTNAANDFQFALTDGGWFEPLPNTETTAGNRVRITGRARLGTGTTYTTLPGAKDTTPFQTDVDDHGNTSFTFSQSASSVGNCNTTGATANRCAPLLEKTVRINIVGNDKAVLDGVFSNFATCREQGPPPEVPEGPPDQTPVGPHCHAVANKMTQENNKVLMEELKSFEQEANATPFVPCTDDYGCGGEEE